MPGFVADASATLPWCFAEEATPDTEALLERLRAGETAFVPAHWSAEVMNGLVMAVRRSRIDRERVVRFARDLAALPIRNRTTSCPGTLGGCNGSCHRTPAHRLRCRVSGARTADRSASGDPRRRSAKGGGGGKGGACQHMNSNLLQLAASPFVSRITANRQARLRQTPL